MKTAARFFSITFHPLFLVNYVLLLLLLINPYLFSVQDFKSKTILILSVFLLTTFFPLISIAMMKALGLVSTLEMKDQKERIGPVISTAIFYLWLFINIKDNTAFPSAFSFFVLGTIIALFLSFFLNNFQKLSLHAVGMGGFITAILLIGNNFTYGSFLFRMGGEAFQASMILLYMAIFLIAGITLTSRLLLHAHSKEEIYSGLFIGGISQLLAFIFFF